MINILNRLEYGIAFLFILIVYFQMDFSIWLLVVLLFVPDITLVGYLFNNTVGAILYNVGHNLIIPLILLCIAYLLGVKMLLAIALIWLTHIAMDRFIGYGLKYKDSFKETHMQKI